MNDLVSEYQQYQDATAEEEGEFNEEEAWFFIILYLLKLVKFKYKTKKIDTIINWAENII